MNKLVLLILFLLLLTPTLSAQEHISVKTYVDKKASGWAYKSKDQAFVVEIPDCKIQWNAIESKKGNLSLRVRKKCEKPFKDQITIHKAILTKINQKIPLTNFQSISWGPLCHKSDWSWCIPIAKASLNSKDYIDYWKHYPNSKITSINKLFVTLANESHSYKELSDIFSEFGVTLKLKSVEKVFEYRLKELPFYDQIKSDYPNINPRAMFNVGFAYFTL
jgi:hypothetical protein